MADTSSQAYLVEQGIYAKDLSKYQYLDRHDRVVAAVLAGDFDAGAARSRPSTSSRTRASSPSRRSTTSQSPGSRGASSTVPGWRSPQGSPRIKDKKVLDAMGEKITGFVEAKDEMYEDVRVGMKKSDEFLNEGRGRAQPLSSEK